jgi:hypothetical protein
MLEHKILSHSSIFENKKKRGCSSNFTFKKSISPTISKHRTCGTIPVSRPRPILPLHEEELVRRTTSSLSTHNTTTHNNNNSSTSRHNTSSSNGKTMHTARNITTLPPLHRHRRLRMTSQDTRNFNSNRNQSLRR